VAESWHIMTESAGSNYDVRRSIAKVFYSSLATKVVIRQLLAHVKLKVVSYRVEAISFYGSLDGNRYVIFGECRDFFAIKLTCFFYHGMVFIKDGLCVVLILFTCHTGGPYEMAIIMSAEF